MPTPDLEDAKMSPAERARLGEELARSRRYFEFGMGGSSLMAVRAGIAEMVSIDSDPAWVDAVRHLMRELSSRATEAAMEDFDNA